MYRDHKPNPRNGNASANTKPYGSPMLSGREKEYALSVRSWVTFVVSFQRLNADIDERVMFASMLLRIS